MDLLLSSDGDLVFTNSSVDVTASRADSITQRLKIKLRTFLGEWFLDTSYGVPYFQDIFGKGRKKSTIDSIIQKAIIEEEGVEAIISYSSTFEGVRSFNVTFQVKVDDGTTSSDINIEVI